MNIQTAVKIGTSRQVVIPKKIHDELGLMAGDYLAVEKVGDNIMFRPQIIGDKNIMKLLERGLKDIREGRTHGPFDSAKEMLAFLDKSRAKYRKNASRTK